MIQIQCHMKIYYLMCPQVGFCVSTFAQKSSVLCPVVALYRAAFSNRHNKSHTDLQLALEE